MEIIILDKHARLRKKRSHVLSFAESRLKFMFDMNTGDSFQEARKLKGRGTGTREGN